jgi:hypothetical protein
MRSVSALAIALPLSLAASCKSHAPAKSAPPKVAEQAPKAAPAAPPASERNGVFAPASPAAVSIWPEAYTGELLVVEVMPQGSAVKEGDVIAKLETRSIDEQVHQAELEATSGAIRHQGVVEKNKIDDDAAAAALAVARAFLDRLAPHEAVERLLRRARRLLLHRGLHRLVVADTVRAPFAAQPRRLLSHH